MQGIDLVKNIVRSFVDEFNGLVNRGIISMEALARYPNFNIHSILQYCLIVAAVKNDVMGLPEYRLRLSRPIDKQAIDHRLRTKRRYIKTLRVDVGFLVDGKLVGVGEVYTPDEIHGCLPSHELEGAWVTPYP